MSQTAKYLWHENGRLEKNVLSSILFSSWTYSIIVWGALKPSAWGVKEPIRYLLFNQDDTGNMLNQHFYEFN